MPIYEYECRNCGQRFERLQSFSDAPVRVCPHCGGETRRVLHPVGVIFKGSGWYVTDSRKPEGETTAAAGPAQKDGGADAGSGGSGASSSAGESPAAPAPESMPVPAKAPASGGES